MAYLLKCLEVAQKNDISFPIREEKIKTNFIR